MRDEDFKMHVGNALPVWPTGRWLSEKYLPYMREKLTSEMREKVQGRMVGIAIDEGRDRNGNPVLGIVTSTWKESWVSMVKVLDDETSVNGKMISESIHDHCVDMRVPKENLRFVTADNASYMSKGVRLLQEEGYSKVERVSCLSHGLNLVMQSFCENCTEAHAVIKKIRKYIRRGRLTARKGRLKCALGKESLHVMNYCKSRWNSYMKAALFLQEKYQDFTHFFEREKLLKQSRGSLEIHAALMDRKTSILLCIVCKIMPAWMDLVISSEGFDTFSVSDLSMIKEAEEEMKRLSAFQHSICVVRAFCGDADEKMVEDIQNTIAHAAAKSSRKFGKYISKTLEYVTQRLIFSPQFAQKMVLPDEVPGVPPEEAVLGRVAIAWNFYKNGCEKEQWAEEVPSSFWGNVIQEDSPLSILRPLFDAVVERSLCCSASEASVERFFSTMGDVINKKKNRLLRERESIELLIVSKKRKTSTHQ